MDGLIPSEQKDVLDRFGREIAGFLPKNAFTRSEHNISHFITGEDLANLEHAATGSVSPWLELSIGAVVGNLVATVVAVIAWTDKKALREIDDQHIAALVLMVFFVGASVAFGLVAYRGRRRTVSAICSGIRQRAKAEIDT